MVAAVVLSAAATRHRMVQVVNLTGRDRFAGLDVDIPAAVRVFPGQNTILERELVIRRRGDLSHFLFRERVVFLNLTAEASQRETGALAIRGGRRSVSGAKVLASAPACAST